jgi:hypothetical protein
MSWGDEASALVGAALQKMVTDDPQGFGELYRQYQLENQSADEAAAKENPKAYGAGQIAGGIAGAVAPGAIASKATGAVAKGAGAFNNLINPAISGAKGLAATAGSSAAQGAIQAAGESTASPFSEPGRFATETVGGGVVGGAAGVIGAGAGKIIQGAGQRFIGKSAAAAEGRVAASELDNPVADVIGAKTGQTQREMMQETDALQAVAKERIGKEIPLLPSQQSGSRRAALAESYAEQSGKSGQIDRAQALRAKGIAAMEENYNAIVNEVASNPAALGKEEVGKKLLVTIDEYGKKLLAARREAAGPVYDEAMALAGGGRLIPTTNLEAAKSEILGKLPADIGSEVKAMLDKLATRTTAKGRVTLEDAQSARSLILSYMRGELNFSGKMSPSLQDKNLRLLRDAMEADFDLAEKGIASKSAVQKLREANAIWREHTQAIESITTDTVDKLFAASEKGAADTITDRIMASSPQQIADSFKLIEKADPAMARQLRAQVMLDRASRFGMQAREGATKGAENATQIRPEGFYKDIIDPKTNAKLAAVFRGDAKAELGFKEATMWLRRASFGPNLRGAQTAFMAEEAMGKAADAAAMAGAPQVGALKKVFDSIFSSKENLATVMSTPEGLDVFNKAMRAGDAIGKGQRIGQSVVSKILTQATVLGLVPNKEPQQ